MVAQIGARIQVLVGIFISLTAYSIILHCSILFQQLGEEENIVQFQYSEPLSDEYSLSSLEQLQLPNSYQCALVWLRLPKTASTTVIRRFVSPLVASAKLRLAEMGPNTCVTHIGGLQICGMDGKQTRRSGRELMTVQLLLRMDFLQIMAGVMAIISAAFQMPV